MNENLEFKEQTGIQVIKPEDQLKPEGKFKIEIVRDGKTIHEEEVKNLVTTVGKNSLLDIGFRNQALIPAWYIGLVDNLNFSTQAVTDTMTAHAGWTEFTGYSEANRQTWVTAAAANAAISNPTPATYNITGNTTLAGLFITSSNTKGGTAGILWSVVTFSATVPVVNGDQIKITYTLNA